MERKTIGTVVGILTIVCGASGFVAEFTRTKTVVKPSGNDCAYPGSPAYGFGLAAAIALVLAEYAITVAVIHTCCNSKGPHGSKSRWIPTLLFFVIFWIGAIYAALCLRRAALLNGTGVYSVDKDSHECPEIKTGLFAIRTIFGLLCISITFNCYGELKSAMEADVEQQQSQDPVFVHDDTYARKQALQV